MFAVALVTALAMQGEVHFSELSGYVINSRGEPVEGASVMIRNVLREDQRKAVSTTLEADCNRWTKTDADGKFTFPHVRDDRRYRVVAQAPGVGSGYSGSGRPGDPLICQLQTVAEELAPRDVKITVGDAVGKPIQGAKVMYSYNWSNSGYATQLAVTDEAGIAMVQIAQNRNLDHYSVMCDGYQSATVKITGHNPAQIRLRRSCSIKGRIIDSARKPVNGLEICCGRVLVRTDADGCFRIDGLQPLVTVVLTSMPGQQAPQVLISRELKSPGQGRLADLGDLESVPARSCKLRVRVANNLSLPKDAEITVTQCNANGSPFLSIPIREKSSVHVIDSLTPEPLTFTPNVRGFEISRTIPAMQRGLNFDVQFRPTKDEQPVLIVLDVQDNDLK